MPHFNSIRDEKDAIEYMFRVLDSYRGISDLKVNRHAAIDKATDILEHRREVIDEFGDDSPVWQSDQIDDFLKNLRIAISGIDPDDMVYVDKVTNNEAPENWSASDAFQWGEWRLESAQSLRKADGEPLGYSPNGELKSSLVPPGGGATWHIYSSIPENISWPLTHIVQKNVHFLIGKAKVCEIDAVSSVPSLPEAITSSETGERVLNRNLAQNEWQRRVDPKRILAIRDFVDIPKNIVANSALLYCPEGMDSITTENGVVTINFEKFLKGADGMFMDHWMQDDADELSSDLRPMWLIDGQHRTRGLSQSEIGSEMEIPIILFTDKFSLNQSAKVFAEINTLQRPLAALHTLFMQHRFEIPTSGGKRDFRQWDKNDSETWDSRQNSLSYECGAWLSSHEGGPLYNRIKILEANQPKFTIIKANSWLDYSRYWFKAQPYGPDCDMTKQQIFQEVENYFQAFVNTCNHNKWPGENPRPRWSPNSNHKGLLQMHSTSRVLLDIYGDVWEKAAMGCGEAVIPVSRFEEILEPFYWVDWLDGDLLERYHGSGEVPRTALRVWMKAAIQEGVKYNSKQVMSKSLKSKPGRGILSAPEDSKVEISSPNEWPIDGKNGAVVLISKRPEHALATARWTVTDSQGKEWGPTGGHKVQSKTEGVSTFKLKYGSWMERIDSIKIKVQWSNVNPPAAHDEIKLIKPDEDE
jgi:DGQHR domain-containing protein